MAALTITKENFEQQVLKNDNKVLLDFWASWCGPCRMVSPVIEEIADQGVAGLTVGKINVDEQPELASRFGVMSIPTLIVMHNGQIVNQAVGARSKQAILGML